MPSSSAISRSYGQVQRRVAGAEAARPGRQLEAPGSLDDRAVQARLRVVRRPSRRRPRRQKITYAGTSWNRSARYDDELTIFAPAVHRRPRPAGCSRRSSGGSARRSACFSSGSVTTTKCHDWRFEAVGACSAISRHSSSSAGSTGRSKSRRLRTERVVVRSSSGVSMSGKCRAAVPPVRAEPSSDAHPPRMRHSLAVARMIAPPAPTGSQRSRPMRRLRSVPLKHPEGPVRPVPRPVARRRCSRSRPTRSRVTPCREGSAGAGRRVPGRPRRADAGRQRPPQPGDVRHHVDGAAGAAADGRLPRQEHDRQGRVPADRGARDALREHRSAACGTRRTRREATGCSTTGSSEAAMLGGLALKRRWQHRRAGRGQVRPTGRTS